MDNIKLDEIKKREKYEIKGETTFAEQLFRYLHASEDKLFGSLKMDNRETTGSKRTVPRNSTLGVTGITTSVFFTVMDSWR